MYKISKEFHCSSSHILHGLEDGHPCGRLHGHNYIFIIELKSNTLNDVGFVKDYGELIEFKKYIDEKLDHKHLNNVFDFNPSAENMAKFLYDKFKPIYPMLSAIEVLETPKTRARYET